MTFSFDDFLDLETKGLPDNYHNDIALDLSMNTADDTSAFDTLAFDQVFDFSACQA